MPVIKRSRLSFRLGLLGFVIFNTPIVSADNVNALFDLPLEELINLRVTSASGYEQTIQDAPAVMMVITRKEMLEYGANNLMEVLQHFPGYLPIADTTFGQRASSLRGDTNISGERVLTLINGRPYRSSVTAVHSHARPV